MVMISLAVLLGMASLTIDVGTMYRARAEAQAAADAAALAAAMELVDTDALTGTPDMTEEIYNARLAAAQYAGMNAVLNSGPSVDTNAGNAITGDVIIGYLANPYDPNATMSFADPNQFNTVRVRVTLNGNQNNMVPLFFAGIFGLSETAVEAEAYATFDSGNTNGFAPNDNTGPSTVMPFAFNEALWTQLLNGTFTTGDNYTYDEATGTVSPGPDGILEVNLYPGAGPAQLPPGNFGTVDIGSGANSTADLSRQIEEGVNGDDIADLGFDLGLANGPFQLQGDTGISAGIKDELAGQIGEARSILLFDTVTGNGNNSIFNITDFAGMRIMAVDLTGAASGKYVIIQPAQVVDGTATFGSGGSGTGGGLVFRPVELIR